MPKAATYIEPNDARRLDVLSSDHDRYHRAARYDKARKYYEGNQKTFLSVKAGEPDDNVVVNNYKIIVDRTVSFLFPSLPVLELGNSGPQRSEAERWLDGLWDHNGGVVLMHGLALNGAFTGHCYVRIIPPRRELGETYSRIVSLSPAAIASFWRPDDLDHIVWHELYFQLDERDELLIDFINRDAEGWEIVEYMRSAGTKWERTKSEEWTLRFPPVIHWQHLPFPNQFYGLPELSSFDLVDKVNLILSEQARIHRYYAAPRMVVMGVDANEIEETSLDGLWAIADTEAKTALLEMRGDGEFSSNLSAALYNALLAEARVVVLRGDIRDFQRVTNAGVRTVFLDQIMKTVLLRHQYGRAMQQISMSAAALAGVSLARVPDVLWPDPLPANDLELAQIAQIERGLGIVSRRTISEKRGYDWGYEWQTMKNEADTPSESAPAAHQSVLTNDDSDV